MAYFACELDISPCSSLSFTACKASTAVSPAASMLFLPCVFSEEVCNTQWLKPSDFCDVHKCLESAITAQLARKHFVLYLPQRRGTPQQRSSIVLLFVPAT